jgi:hypothetical protein
MAARKSSTGPKRPRAANPAAGEQARRCGLCGKTSRLRKTECCGEWICDDEGSYVLFSYARNSCSRNHGRYTLCGFHHAEGHAGDWRECTECREAFETEIYVYYGTNEHNFVTLEDPPAFEPTLCSGCGARLNLGEGGYAYDGDGYQCLGCAGIDLGRLR